MVSKRLADVDEVVVGFGGRRAAVPQLMQDSYSSSATYRGRRQVRSGARLEWDHLLALAADWVGIIETVGKGAR